MFRRSYHGSASAWLSSMNPTSSSPASAARGGASSSRRFLCNADGDDFGAGKNLERAAHERVGANAIHRLARLLVRRLLEARRAGLAGDGDDPAPPGPFLQTPHQHLRQLRRCAGRGRKLDRAILETHQPHIAFECKLQLNVAMESRQRHHIFEGRKTRRRRRIAALRRERRRRADGPEQRRARADAPPPPRRGAAPGARPKRARPRATGRRRPRRSARRMLRRASKNYR